MLLKIVVISLVGLFFAYLIGSYIYKRVHHLPTGECGYCHTHTSKQMIKEYHKMFPKEQDAIEN